MATKTSITERVRAYQKMHPNATTAQVAKACKTTVKYVYGIRYSDKRGGANVKTPKQQWKMVHMSTSKESALPFKEEAERIYELTKGRQRMHPVTGKLLMQGSERFKKESVIQEDTPADRVEDHPLYHVFVDAIKQAMHGKGERHGGARTPFLEQPWAHYTKMHGRGFATGQATKKLEEAASTRSGEAFEQEVFGAIVYAGMAILKERGQV